MKGNAFWLQMQYNAVFQGYSTYCDSLQKGQITGAE